MITCPNCDLPNAEGAIFCANCGRQLEETITREEDVVKEHIPVEKAEETDNTAGAGNNEISLLVLDKGKTITITGQKEYSIGRISKGQAIIPDIDLAPYDGYKKGVSRLHAYLKIDQRGVAIVDMGSANGTKVNGQRIAPNVDFPLKHADTIVLGSVPLQVIMEFQ